jgi:uncharacterized protein involved in response to NO
MRASAPAAKEFRGPVLFARGFRPFFLLAGVYAVLSVGAWVLLIRGWAALPTGFSPPFWHGHEMLFGYAAAAMAGFLLTAVPNWTGTRPLQGRPLGGLVALWLAGRIAVWAGAALPPVWVAAVDLAFLPVLALLMARVLWPARKPKNFAFVALLALLFVANLHGYVPLLGEREDAGLVLAVDVMVLLIVIVGGRITPSFTSGALRQRDGAPPVTTYPWLERLAILSTLGVVMADLFALPAAAVGALALLAGGANAARLLGYRTRHTLRQPIVWSLHLGYAWAVLGLLLKGLAAFSVAEFSRQAFAGVTIPATAALHALTVGAIGTMTLAVMSRAALGHTGRPLVAPAPVVWAYGLITLAALVRVFTPIFLPALYLEAIVGSGALWVAAFALYLAAYTPILIRPRADGQPG